MITIVPHPKQLQFLKSPEKYVMAIAGTQSGKTIAGAHKFISRLIKNYKKKKDLNVLNNPITNAWVIAPEYQLLKEAQRNLKTILEELPELNKQVLWNDMNCGVYHSCTIFGDKEIKISFRSASRPELLVSEPVDLIWIDEFCRITDSAWIVVEGRMGARPDASVILTSSPIGQNFAFDYFVKGRRIGEQDWNKDKEDNAWRSFLWYSVDNPIADKTFLEQRRRSLPEAWYLREHMADFRSFSGKIFPDFMESKHVQPTCAGDWSEIIMGIDFGITHKGAMVVVGIDRMARKAGVLKEVIIAEKTTDWWFEQLLKLYKQYPMLSMCLCDPSGKNIIVTYRNRLSELYATGQLRSFPTVTSAKNDVFDGISTIAEMFVTNAITIDPSCTGLIRELQSYRWKENSTGLEQPIKENDDGIDALRYAIFRTFGKK